MALSESSVEFDHRNAVRHASRGHSLDARRIAGRNTHNLERAAMGVVLHVSWVDLPLVFRGHVETGLVEVGGPIRENDAYLVTLSSWLSLGSHREWLRQLDRI